MSVIVVPGAFRREAHPVGKLAGTLLSVAVAGLADPPRFRRGKAYVAERAVARLDIGSGVVEAVVMGSRPEPYHVVIAVPTVAAPADTSDPTAYRGDMNRLVPDGSELMMSCSCPDWDDPCKHAVAALLCLADEVAGRPELMLAWRCGEGRRPRPGRAGLAPPRPLSVPAAPPDPFATDAWREFEGHDREIPAMPLPSPLNPIARSALDVTGAEELMASMLDAITGWR